MFDDTGNPHSSGIIRDQDRPGPNREVSSRERTVDVTIWQVTDFSAHSQGSRRLPAL
ncbi:hypothetical protein HRR99_20965 [Agrobacterium vaccinii]|uniref:hypothetical protein n=1 Tax=Agrobacterium vaccinii TaxID=2735528 RepID=UPI001E2F7FEE|nr:hypothetical protein [Agrobacterium vaccinii]UHS63987.1 hypothetical protein HRR99_20965 [Agrobacterium vaccinii]